MTYKVIQDQNRFDILEKDTELVVYSTRQQNVARDLCRSLNLGSGFGGHTPPFFAVHTKKEKSTV